MLPFAPIAMTSKSTPRPVRCVVVRPSAALALDQDLSWSWWLRLCRGKRHNLDALVLALYDQDDDVEDDHFTARYR